MWCRSILVLHLMIMMLCCWICTGSLKFYSIAKTFCCQKKLYTEDNENMHVGNTVYHLKGIWEFSAYTIQVCSTSTAFGLDCVTGIYLYDVICHIKTYYNIAQFFWESIVIDSAFNFHRVFLFLGIVSYSWLPLLVEARLELGLQLTSGWQFLEFFNIIVSTVVLYSYI